jgi:hypothetical protein
MFPTYPMPETHAHRKNQNKNGHVNMRIEEHEYQVPTIC